MTYDFTGRLLAGRVAAGVIATQTVAELQPEGDATARFRYDI